MEKKELICLACYEERLASVFDTAATFLFYTKSKEGFSSAGHLCLPSTNPMDRVLALASCGVTTLLCGALCGCTKQQLTGAGIVVRPWLCGNAEVVLSAFLDGTLEEFCMPGCRPMNANGSPSALRCCAIGNRTGGQLKGRQRGRGCHGGDFTKRKGYKNENSSK